MDNPNILIVDHDPKNLQILKDSLEASNFKVIAAANGHEALNIIQAQRPDIIISEVDLPGLDGFQLLERLQKDSSAASIPIVFLTNRPDLENKIKSLRSGAKDYMIKPLHVKEVIARINMILRRINRIKGEDTESNRKIVGRLEENSVEELVENYGVERRTGILSLYDQNNRNGEIYFREGAVVNARLGNFKAEKAVYQMLPWQRGHFIMILKDVDVRDEISVSNLGLLLQGFKRLQERERLLHQLPPLETVFVKTAIFEQVLKKKSISTDAYKFISLFDGKRTLSEIISESAYDDLKTLQRIIKLHEQGFIRPINTEFAKPLTETAPPESEKISLPKPQIKEPPKQIGAYEEGPEFPETIEPELTDRIQDAPEMSEPSHTEVQEPHHDLEDSEELSYIKPFNQLADRGSVQRTPEATEEPVVRESFFDTDQEDAKDDLATPEETEANSDAKIHTDSLASVVDDLLSGQEGNSGQLVIISPNNRYRQELIATMTAGDFSQKSVGSGNDIFELGRIPGSNGRTLELIGLPTERKYLQMMDRLSSTLVGYVILIIGDKMASLEYLGYLINTLNHKFKVPSVLAVYHPFDKKAIPLDVIRYSLNIDENEQLVDLENLELDNLQHLLKQLQPPDYAHPFAGHTSKMIHQTD